uniref:NADH dehydrogenase subunit 6 n=2 Tax=Pristionchus pacificus TaxID=54126 RepID=F2YQ26_PRIPA|nr:NADH dehydrogenase subunit 6 [Pristionchus pacificus]ADZ52288.1 NADH dehydrogenase subunit 6 [Pristionchus pacificus]
MLMMFFIISVVFCVLCFMNLDPMKSSFFLIFSLLSSMPIMSFSNHVWYSYFICLLFLSGIFVILVYFSSLSKINFVKSKLVLTSMFLMFILCAPVLMFSNENLSLVNFYYNSYWFFMAFIMLILLMFMNFSSYFLNFSGALRKI